MLYCGLLETGYNFFLVGPHWELFDPHVMQEHKVLLFSSLTPQGRKMHPCPMWKSQEGSFEEGLLRTREAASCPPMKISFSFSLLAFTHAQLNAQATLLPCYDPQEQQSPVSPSQSWNVSFSLLASKRPGSRDPLGGVPVRKAKHLHLFIFYLTLFQKGLECLTKIFTIGFLKADEEIG